MREVDSSYAWRRLMVALAIGTIGTNSIYVVSVVLPAVQAEFGVSRSDASLPYSLVMIGFGLGGLLMGRLADRFGVMWVILLGALGSGAGYLMASAAGGLLSFAVIHGVMLGLLGASSSFSPLLADTSLWFDKRRGIAVAVCASGNYLSGIVTPPVVQRFVEAHGWRATYVGLGLFTLVTMVGLALLMRPRPPVQAIPAVVSGQSLGSGRPFGMNPGVVQLLLSISATACCVAMAMPQVHIVAYCADLGYGAARGAEMLSVAFGCGLVSRIGFGFISDRIGGLRTLLVGSLLQTLALVLFIPFNSLVSLYVIAALFGLFQGGIVPSYALIVREHFPAARAATLVGDVLMFSLLGMALGGWMTGKGFDLTGSYRAAFVNGVVWSLIPACIALFFLGRLRPPLGRSPAAVVH